MGLGVLAIAGAAAAVGGQIYTGMAQKAEAQSAQAMENYKAQVAEQDAKAIEQRTRLEQRRAAQSAARRMSALEAGLAASGAVTTVGAPLMLQATQAAEDEMENLMIGYEGQIEASRARSRAAGYRMSGKMAKQRGRSRATSSFIGAGSSLIKGFQ